MGVPRGIVRLSPCRITARRGVSPLLQMLSRECRKLPGHTPRRLKIMKTEDPDLENPPRTTGTIDDDDEPEDENEGENEAPIRERSEATEAPEEFNRDDEDDDEDDVEDA